MRRDLRRSAPVLAAIVAAALLASSAPRVDPWTQVAGILARIAPPAFPARICDITAYGAVGDGRTLATESIRKAVEACGAAGGGRVLVPAGEFLTGPIHLRSNIDLHVAKGARLRFTHDPGQYVPLVLTRYEGTDCYNYSPFVYALRQENVAITGAGVLDGQGSHPAWEAVRKLGRGRIRELAEEGVPVEKRRFGVGHGLRPSMVQFYESRNILIEGVTLKDAPMWMMHFVLSENVSVRNVVVENAAVNGDGIDIESSRDVLVRGCVLRTRDDGIAIKSGRDADGRRRNTPTQDVVIQDTSIVGFGRNPRNGIAVGSEVSGGARNVFVENTRIADRFRGICLKSNARRGGVIERIYVRNVELRGIVEPAFALNLVYGNERGPFPPVVRDVEIRDCKGAEIGYLLAVDRPPEATVANVVVRDCVFEGVGSLANRAPDARGIEIVDVKLARRPLVPRVDPRR